MNSVSKACLMALIAALLSSACTTNFGKPSPKVDYYALEYDPPVKAAETDKMPFSIQIKRFRVSPLYNSNKIIFRDKAYARNEYHYHKWRANPGDTVTYFLKRDLQQSSLLKAVFSHEDGFACDYLLEGAVDEFLEQESQNSWEAVLSITVALLKTNEPDVSKSVIFQKAYRSRAACRQKNPKSLSEAMSLAMAQISQQVMMDISSALKTVR